MNVWLHKSTGNEYEVVSDNAIMKVNGEWIDCVVYKPLYENQYEMFSRDKDDFYEHFEKGCEK